MSEPTGDSQIDMSAALNAAISAGDSSPAPDTQEPSPQVVESPTAQPVGNPSWNEVLSAIPQSLHDTIRPVLQKWDQGVQDRFAAVHSQYDPYKPFVEKKVDPEAIDAALQLYGVLEKDPQRLYDELAAYLGVSAPPSGQGQQQQPEQDLGEFQDAQFDITRDPRFQALAQQQEQMQQFLMQQAKEQEERSAQVWLDTQLSKVHQSFKAKGIEPSMGYVMGVASGKINTGTDPEKAITEAVAQYEAEINKIRSLPVANNGAPPVLAPSGATPSTPFNPAALSEQDAKKLMGEMLSQAFKE
jgi:hypothetical protein